MDVFLELSFGDYLHFAAVVTASVVAITAYSLSAYALAFNFRSHAARQFAFLAACVLVVFAMDVAVARLGEQASAELWLRVQWIGLALLPAAYFGFASSVLQATHHAVGYRGPLGIFVLIACVGLAFFALFTDALVLPPAAAEQLPHLRPGPLFWLFAAAFLLALAHSIRDLMLARSRSLTQAGRRRNTLLLLGFVAPALGSFPYLVAFGEPLAGAVLTVLQFSVLVNVATAVLLSLMMLAVAYHGVALPDRVVRYRLVRFAIRGPFVAILVIVALQTVPPVEASLGLPRDLVVFSVVSVVIVAGQLLMSLSRPLVDLLIYREDAREIHWLRELERRLLTPSDIQTFLENHLISLCEFLQASRGFVAAISDGNLAVEAATGMSDQPDEIMSAENWRDLLRESMQRGEGTGFQPLPTMRGGLYVWPLFGHEAESPDTVLLGFVGAQTEMTAESFGVRELLNLQTLQARMAEALMDRRLQIDVLRGLRHIIPELRKIQDLRGRVPYPGEMEADSPKARERHAPDPEFTAWVRDALRNLWAGPRLARSPLIHLRAMGMYLDKTKGNSNHALRLLLGDAIEGLRPADGAERGHLDTLLYQILEMRFIQGRKVREIASKLAMSESDLYRKQRVAIEQVVTILQEMEEAAHADNSASLRNDDLADTSYMTG